MNRTLMTRIKKRFACNAWLRRASAPMLATLLALVAPLAQAGLSDLIGLGGDSSKLPARMGTT